MPNTSPLPTLSVPTIDASGVVTLAPDPQANADAFKSQFALGFGLPPYPGDPESLLIDLLAYAYTLSQYGIQEAARQVILTYATGENLDLIAAPFGVERLSPTYARVTIRFSGSAISSPRFIPTGTRVRSDDGLVMFATVESGTIPGGTSGHVDLICEARQIGGLSNGYAPGSITRLIDPIPSVTATNITESQGGAEGESDDRLRQRVPEALNAAAPSTRAGYSAVVKRLSPLIADVGVFGPLERNALGLPTRLGEVDLFILAVDGMPSSELISQIESQMSEGDRTRIVADFVHVLPPERVGYVIYCGLVVLPEVDSVVVRSQAEAAIRGITGEWAQRLGTDVIKNRLISEVMAVFGVVDVVLTAPNSALNRSQWGDLESLTVEVIGES